MTAAYLELWESSISLCAKPVGRVGRHRKVRFTVPVEVFHHYNSGTRSRHRGVRNGGKVSGSVAQGTCQERGTKNDS